MTLENTKTAWLHCRVHDQPGEGDRGNIPRRSISSKDHVTNEEVRAKIQQAIGPHGDQLLILVYYLPVKGRKKLARNVMTLNCHSRIPLHNVTHTGCQTRSGS